MKEYDIHPDFKVLGIWNPPATSLMFRLENSFLDLVSQGIRSDGKCKVSKVKVETRDGKKIRLFIFEPKNVKKKTPALLYIHGGGFTNKAAPTHYMYAYQYALKAKCKVFFVDYRLAPKNAYPIPLLDCQDTYEYILNHEEEYHIDGSRIAIGGDSAGGFLSASLIFKLHKENKPLPIFVMLIYPVLDQRMETLSMKEFTDTPIWNSKLNQKMWKFLLGNQKIVSPSEEKDVSFFPPTYLETADYDCLHDEGALFAQRLEENGISVIYHATHGTVHGYDAIYKSKIAKDSVRLRIETLKKVFKNS